MRSCKSISEKFWSKVNKNGSLILEDCCWEWVGKKNRDGYGILNINNVKFLRSNRLSWQIHFGEIPKGLSVLHKCDNRSCIRPTHLWVGTQTDNILDMDLKKRRNPPKGSKNAKAKLKESQILEIRKLYELGTFSQTYISKQFGVSFSVINKIVNYKLWRHICLK